MWHPRSYRPDPCSRGLATSPSLAPPNVSNSSNWFFRELTLPIRLHKGNNCVAFWTRITFCLTLFLYLSLILREILTYHQSNVSHSERPTLQCDKNNRNSHIIFIYYYFILFIFLLELGNNITYEGNISVGFERNRFTCYRLFFVKFSEENSYPLAIQLRARDRDPKMLV